MSTLPRITGTFLDEITYDIPSQNWSYAEWRREFELYKKIGIDTAIIIRAGLGNKCIFNAKSVPDLLPVYEDLAEIYFSLGDELGIGIYFGIYDTNVDWYRGSFWREIDINKKFIDEAVERYGHHKSFVGWYLVHETGTNCLNVVDVFNALGRHCKEAKDLPVLISPFPQGNKDITPSFTIETSMEHWDYIFRNTQGAFDICAFQDGQIQYEDLPEFLHGISALAAKYGVTQWSNLETFDRDMPFQFPPADWRYLRFKMEAAAPISEKIITFEFSHFMSPYSCYPAARNLFNRYAEYADLDLS